MVAFFIIILVLTFGIARFAQRRFDDALKAGSLLTLPGGQTAAEAAREFLDAHDRHEVKVLEHTALVTNYYDPGRKCLFLDRKTYDGVDTGSWAVALHEASHALQEGDAAKAYHWRLSNIRLTRYAPTLVAGACLILMVVKRLPFPRVLMICSLLWALVMLVNVLSLPVEFNASQRVLAWLENKLRRHPALIDNFATLLPRVAWRDTGAFLRSPLYVLHGMLPVGGRLRPR